MADDLMKAFIVDPADKPKKESKDDLRVFYDRCQVLDAFTRNQKNQWRYIVENITKKERGDPFFQYYVLIWKNGLGDLTASCDCEARLLCKHIRKAVKVHLIAMEAGFINE